MASQAVASGESLHTKRVLASSRVVLDGRIIPGTIVVSLVTGKIEQIFDSVRLQSEFESDALYTDYSPHVLMPGIVDAHVHLNEPGRTEWEGFWTGTRAAAFGGVTTVIDMPLNAIPPTTTVAGFHEKINAARGKCWVDVGFYGGLIPGNVLELRPLVAEGVRGFKGFLIDSGVEEFPAVSPSDIALALKELAAEPTIAMFHAEMLPIATSTSNNASAPSQPTGPLDHYQTFLDSRPSTFEIDAIAEILSLSHLAPHLPLHIVHLSAIEAIPLLREARSRGVKVTAETCFHYLSLAAEEIRNGDTRHKCCPPIRSKCNQDGLWQELLRVKNGEDSVIHTIVSDHSPCTPDLKLLPSTIPGSVPVAPKAVASCSGDFMAAWGGVSSVGLGLPILWTEGQRHKIDLPDIVNWCCVNTARQVGLENSKGSLAVGMDADIIVFDDEAEWIVKPDTMLFRNKCSPYEGHKLRGKVRETILRGQSVFGSERGFDETVGPLGKLLLERRVCSDPSYHVW